MLNPPEFESIAVTVLSLHLEEKFLWAHAGAWSFQTPAHEERYVGLAIISVLVALFPCRGKDGDATCT